MPQIVTVDEYEDLKVALDLAHRRAIWRMIDNGMPEPESFPPLQISAIVVPNRAAINAVPRLQRTEEGETVQREIVPDVESITTRKSTGTNTGTNTSTEDAADESDETGSTSDRATDQGTETDRSTETSQQTDNSDQTNTYGKEDSTSTSVTV